MPVSEATYEQLALEDSDRKWELVCGQLREKPVMTAHHYQIVRTLAEILILQLDLQRFTVATDSGRLRVSSGSYYVPDLTVIPRDAVRRKQREEPTRLEVYDEPMPLVVEVWSPSTGRYDVQEKLTEYQRRGDLEIWRIHPYERTLTAWRRQPDGAYIEAQYSGGSIQPTLLPHVTVIIERLFD